jgi:hypothetical protein
VRRRFAESHFGMFPLEVFGIQCGATETETTPRHQTSRAGVVMRNDASMMGLDLFDAIERGFLLLFAFLCILAFIIPFYCYRPHHRQRERDIEAQDESVQRASQLPYTDDPTNSPR